MIKQSLAFNDILEKKFKILRTSIMLGNLRNRNETLSEYEETAKEIDKIKTSIYEELLSGKVYTTTTLEEESARLKELIAFIEKRVSERNDFVDDYIKITSNFLDGLDKISLEDELNNYRIRYNNIEEYLNNCEEIRKLELRLKDLKNELAEKYENKANNELINAKLEDELIEEFNRFISRNSYYSSLNYTDLDLELSKVEESIIEKKSVLDTFNSSYQALVSAGISGAEREEYASYVMDAKINYYEDIEKKSILNIYKLVLDKQVDYDRLYSKREKIDIILNNRESFINELNIKKNRDDLEYFVSLSKEQFSIIRSQKFNIENIDKLILEVSNCESELEYFENNNNRAEIIDILDEYSVKKVEVEKTELPEEIHYYDENIIDNVDSILNNVTKPFNVVINIKEPDSIDVDKASKTAKLVMKKVVMVLEPKKFNHLKDEVLNDSAKEEVLDSKYENDTIDIVHEEFEDDNVINEDISVEKESDITNDELLDNNIIENLFADDIFNEEEVLETEISDNIFEDSVNTTIEDVQDIFLDDNPDKIKSEVEVGIDVNTEDIFKDTYDGVIQDDNPDNSTIVDSSKIFFEEPKTDVGLFESTDPFLDDNDLELDKSNDLNNSNAFVPNFGSIGTVKPNNALSKIEDVVKETSDVVLPNLGLVDSSKTDVPIVSENYIS